MKNTKADVLRIYYGLSVYDNKEIKRVVKSLRRHESSLGIETREFEQRIAKIFGKKYGVMVNSGSSANLLALEILNLPRGSEVITPILTFSTTVAPIIKLGLIPSFVDVEPGKYTVDAEKIKKSINKNTKALMIPLLLGNVPDMEKLSRIAKEHNLFLIVDSCDTIGPMFKSKPIGFYSDIVTASFYASHVITAGGNGGMLMVNSKRLRDRLMLLRGWGRSSSIFSESENIEKRFRKKIQGIPYDAKFLFEEIGYNFLPSEMGAAFGNEQLNKLDTFRKTRQKNFNELYRFFKKYEKYFILPVQDKSVNTQWLAFPLTIKKSAPFSRFEIVTYLEKNNVQTRPIFTGNVLKQPGFKNIKYKSAEGEYAFVDQVTRNGFVVGCHHGLKSIHIRRLEELFTIFLNRFV